MKAKILTATGLWLLLISLAHVQLNIGWANAAEKVKVLLGLQRAELVVGFLPVT